MANLATRRNLANRRASPTAGKDQDARRRLVAAAESALIANDGALEMADVAARAGASAGLAYHYFGSKAGLVSSVVNAFYDRYDAVINQRMDPRESWARRERRRLENVIDFLFSDPAAPVALGRLSRSPEIAAVEAARQRAMVELAAHNIENGKAGGDIPHEVDSHIAGAAILGGVRDAFAWAFADENVDRETLAESLWAFIAGAVRLRETTP